MKFQGSKDMYKNKPHLGRGEDGKVGVQTATSKAAPQSGDEEADEGMGGMPVHEAVMHAHERTEMAHKHVEEHLDMHRKHEMQHGMHDGDKKPLHAKHMAEKKALHDKHEKEMATLHASHEGGEMGETEE